MGARGRWRQRERKRDQEREGVGEREMERVGGVENKKREGFRDKDRLRRGRDGERVKGVERVREER